MRNLAKRRDSMAVEWHMTHGHRWREFSPAHLAVRDELIARGLLPIRFSRIAFAVRAALR